MLFTDRKTDVCSNRFGGDGDVIITHYIDEKKITEAELVSRSEVKKTGNVFFK